MHTCKQILFRIVLTLFLFGLVKSELMNHVHPWMFERSDLIEIDLSRGITDESIYYMYTW